MSNKIYIHEIPKKPKEPGNGMTEAVLITIATAVSIIAFIFCLVTLFN